MPAMTRRRRCGAPGARCVARQRRGQLGRQRGIAKYHLLDHASPGRALRRACLLLQPVTDLQSHCSPHLIKTTNEPPHDERRRPVATGAWPRPTIGVTTLPPGATALPRTVRAPGMPVELQPSRMGCSNPPRARAVDPRGLGVDRAASGTAGVSRRHSTGDPFVARALTLRRPRGSSRSRTRSTENTAERRDPRSRRCLPPGSKRNASSANAAAATPLRAIELQVRRVERSRPGDRVERHLRSSANGRSGNTDAISRSQCGALSIG